MSFAKAYRHFIMVGCMYDRDFTFLQFDVYEPVFGRDSSLCPFHIKQIGGERITVFRLAEAEYSLQHKNDGRHTIGSMTKAQTIGAAIKLKLLALLCSNTEVLRKACVALLNPVVPYLFEEVVQPYCASRLFVCH